MRKTFLTGVAVCSLLASFTLPASRPQPPVADNKQLAALFDAYWEKNNRLFPLSATSQGDNRYNDQLPNDQTKAYRDTLQAFYQGYLGKLNGFKRAQLSDNDRISYDIFQYKLQTELNGLKQNAWMTPFKQFWGLPISFVQFGSGQGAQPFRTVQDYDTWMVRARQFPLWADSAISNFRRGARAGVVLPRALVVKMIPQAQALVVTDATKSTFYGPITKLPASFSPADKQRLTAAYQQLILTEIVPTYKKLADFLQNEYLPKARTTTGLADVPGGPELYKYYVKNWTTTDKTPEEIYQTGLGEVQRIRREMERVKAQVGFQGDLPAFFTYMKTDQKFMPYKTPEEVLTAYCGIQARITPALPKYFSRQPTSAFEIRQTEAFRAAAAAAEYNRAAADGSRPGIFYVPILDAATFTTPGMESLFLHEAIPGHHFHISLQQENTALPKFRRFGGYSASSEGWALYTESLGKELGLYTDPYQYMGALSNEIHRAIRLVVDVGMNTKGMTREQAIKYMMDNEAINEQKATAEIERYMAIPGQALSYKIGQLKIQELRDKYKKQLGSKFSLRAFHDEFLKDGIMPLAVLERKMDAWAATQK
jgi:uncharacterized protein (DUF885 family)